MSVFPTILFLNSTNFRKPAINKNMALPHLSAPRYTTTLPVSKEVITYRPFMVKEEKSILLARKTSENPVDILETLIDAMKACITQPENFDVRGMNYVDYRYLIMKIRNQSKGSDISGKLECRECKNKTDVTFDFETAVRIINNEPENMPDKIMLQDDIGFIPRMISIQDVIDLSRRLKLKENENIEAKLQSDPDTAFRFMACSIKAIFDADNVHTGTPEEFEAYIEAEFTEEHLMILANYMKNLPRLQMDLSFDCPACKAHNEVIVEGDTDFFR